MTDFPITPPPELDAEPMIHLDSEQGKNILPGLRRTFTLWGTCGYGRDIRISMEPVND